MCQQEGALSPHVAQFQAHLGSPLFNFKGIPAAAVWLQGTCTRSKKSKLNIFKKMLFGFEGHMKEDS